MKPDSTAQDAYQKTITESWKVYRESMITITREYQRMQQEVREAQQNASNAAWEQLCRFNKGIPR